MSAQVKKPLRRQPNKPGTPKQLNIINTINTNPNLSTREVAKICDTDHSHVVRIMQRYYIVKEETDDYKEHRADILAGLQHRLIKSITDEEIKKAPIGSRVLAACQIYDKERLERGQATSFTMQIHADIKELKGLQKQSTNSYNDLDD